MNIGEAAKKSGLTAKMIRYYESIGLLQNTQRSAAGYRRYSEQDLHNLVFIRRARDFGFSLEDVGQLLQLWQGQGASADVKALATRHLQRLNEKIAELSQLRDSLETLSNQCQGDQRPDCPILNACSTQV